MSVYFSIIVINYGTPDLVLRLLKSIANAAQGLVPEVIVVDNGYPQKGDSRGVVHPERFPFPILFVQNPASSYASGVNRGAAQASGEYFALSNSDIQLLPDSPLLPLLHWLDERPRIGVAGPQLVYPDGTWQRSYGRFPSLREAVISMTMRDSLGNGITAWAFRHGWKSRRPKAVDYVDGAFMVVRRSCFEALGGFDETYDFYGEDVDFCWRARQAGWKVVFVPRVRVMHLRGASSTADALSDYTVRLFQAKLKFVKEHFGLQRGKWYERFMRGALYERSWLYEAVARWTRRPHWRQRSQQARIRYDAVKERVHEGSRR